MSKDNLVGKNLLSHFLDQTLFPSSDKELWLSYLVLKSKYPNITYWSYDGFHVYAIVDYEMKLILAQRGNEQAAIYEWTGLFEWEKVRVVHSFDEDLYKLCSSEIVNCWMGIVGETVESKRKWVSTF